MPHELRPPAVLSRTMDYLITNILDLGNDNNWPDWFDFIWNRTRSIRKVGNISQYFPFAVLSHCRKSSPLQIDIFFSLLLSEVKKDEN